MEKKSHQAAWISIGAGLLAVAGVWFGFSGRDPKPTACSEKDPQPRIVAFGDSLVTGYGATTEGGFVTMVAQDIGVPIVNLGKNGDTTESAKERVSSVISAKPDIVILLLGGNDVLRRLPAAAAEANLLRIIDEITKTGTKVVLLGVPGGLPYDDPYPTMYKRLTQKPNVSFVSNIFSGIILNRQFMSDNIHPNEEGYTKIAARVAPAVRAACASLSP